MSGPKVVRVVTREEIIAICQGQLARLDAAVEQWSRVGRGHDTLSEGDIAAVERRRNQIGDLLARDRFLDLQKAVTEEIDFLKADQQERLDKAALAAARVRTAARREEEAAGALLAALKRSGKTVPAGMEASLKAAAEGRVSAASALTAGFALLSAPSAANRGRIHALAQRLKGEERDRSLETWMVEQTPSKDELSLAQIETRLGELSTLVGAEAAVPYEARLVALRRGEGGDRRALLLDSLALDLGKALVQARTQRELQEKVGLALAELVSLSPALAQAFERDLAPFSARPELQARLEGVEAAIAAERERQAAGARRRTVLEGLAALGYEVGEELSTAWVKDGRVVLRKPAQPGYGVEVAGGSNAERLQMRVVAFADASVDNARDRDAETLWCMDVAQLQERLAAAGATLTIDRALPVGAVPVKRVADVAAERHTAAREGPATRGRPLR